MSSVVRNGFSLLNRLMGKKSKDSKLSRSTENLDESVTLEQTLEITIYLPRDQFYVVRVGAKTKLWQLLEMVCTNQFLDKNKFEFRHASDSSQVYIDDLIIGEVRLLEIRLSLKTDSHHEPYPKYHTNKIIKLRPNSQESLSASEFNKNSG